MWLNHKKAFLSASLGGVLLLAGAIVALVAARPPHPQNSGPIPEPPSRQSAEEEEDGIIPVHTAHPRRDASFTFSAEQPAYVEAYYRADLEAQVPGRVKFIRKDKGSKVTRGELLVQIEVPDLDQEVAKKEAVVKRSLMDLKVAEKFKSIAEAAATVAQLAIPLREEETQEARYTMEFRQLELNRIQIMVRNNTVYQELADEKDRTYKSASSAYNSALVLVKKAQADYKEAQVKVEAAAADVDLKKAMVEVAQKERDQTQAQADYAKITAPFDGVVTERNVGPGSFVKNATTGHTEPLLTVERTDIVTVFMRLPDTFAPYVVDNETDAVIEMSALPGQLFHGKVTRHPPSLNRRDRRMRVEVDLYNGTEADYQRFLAREQQTQYADLKEGALAMLPKITGKHFAVQTRRLLPGMVGKMTLVFQKIGSYLVPSNAVFTEGGKPYIYEIKDRIAHLIPVEIQVDDGKLAKISKIVRVGDEEIKQDLTGEEEIVITNQGELCDGQKVRATLLGK